MINNVRERNPMPEQAREVRCTNFNEVALAIPRPTPFGRPCAA